MRPFNPENLSNLAGKQKDMGLSPGIIDISFDKCDPTKASVVFSLSVEQDKSEKVEIGLCVTDFNTSVVTFRLIKTIEINALPSNIFSSGIVNECYNYEIHRFCPGGFTECPDEEEGDEDMPQDDALISTNIDCMKIIFPMTKEIKCLAPDFGLQGMLANQFIESTLHSRVRIVSVGPNPVIIPASLTYDKEQCTACLTLNNTIFNDDGTKTLFGESMKSDMNGYEHLFGSRGCEHLKNKFQIECPTETSDECCLVNLFQYLSFFRKFNVMGVDKCSQTVLFSFELCTVPTKSPIVNSDCPNKLVGFSYKIQSRCSNYCFQFGRCEESIFEQNCPC